MPISFIVIVIVIALLFLLMYKKIQPFGISKLFLGTLLFLMLCGFFISPINAGNSFNVNVMFAFCTLALSLEILFKTNLKTKIFVLAGVVISVGAYYLLTHLNNDNLTFLNYFPIIVLVTSLSMLFVKNLNAGVSYLMLSYFLIEWLNYFNFANNIGYLSICSFEFLNAVAISVCIFTSVHLVLKSSYKWKLKKMKEVNYEKK